jgi:hypothetical protein
MPETANQAPFSVHHAHSAKDKKGRQLNLAVRFTNLNEAQNPTLYRVRIKDGHNAVGLLVSAAGKRRIPSTQLTQN